MTWWSDTAAILAISQLIVLGLISAIHSRGTQARLLTLFCVCMIAYLTNQLSIVPPGSFSSYLLNRFSTATVLVLWLFSMHLFVDDGKVKPLAWILMAFFVIVRTVGVPLYDPTGPNSDFWFVIIYFIPQVILLVFSLHVIWLAVSGYRHDLLGHRRIVRVVFVVCMGIVLSVLVGNGFFSFVDPFLSQIALFSINPLPGIVFPLYLFIATTGLNLTIFRLQDDAFDLLSAPTVKATPIVQTPVKAHDKHSAALARIVAAMEEEKLFTDSELTIAKLAKMLSMQEYRLRRLINQRLRYRNFNQFLNHYRIVEASSRLANTDKAISSIAMEVGYASLSSFNKAFKEITGTTPSAYRSAMTTMATSQSA